MPDPIVTPRLVRETERPIKRISAEVVARSAVIRRNGHAGHSPFITPSFPPVVEQALADHNIPTIAQDESIGGTYAWAARDQIATAYAEGVVFMGFAYLATLSQRPEYRVVTEVIATEMTREWIEIKAASGDESKAEKIKQLNDILDNLGVRKAFQKVTESDGFFGRGHLYLDTGVTDDQEELQLDLGDGRNLLSKQKVGSTKSGKRQRLLRVTPVEATWCYPTRYDSVDPLNPDWYRPITWFCMSREVHRSRLLTFVGRELPDILKPAYAFGGLSMSQMLKPYIDNWLRTRQSVSDLIQSFSTSVLKTNMDATTSVGGEQLFNRVALFNNVKNNQGTMVVDKDAEDFSNVAAPLGGLDSLQAQSQEHMAAISRIPLVKLLGIQPAGLNASSEGELQAFEDWIAAFQEVFYRPHLTRIIDFVQLSEFDEVDDDITFDFKPLRQEKPVEKDQRQQIQAQTREVYFGMGAVDPNEVREALAQDPDTPFDGVDLSKELPEPPAPPMPGMPPAPGAPPGPPGGAPGGPKPPGGGNPPSGNIAPPKPPAPGTGGPDQGLANGSFGEQLVTAMNDANQPAFADKLLAALNQHAQDAGFKESDFDRDEGGKFTSGGGSSEPHVEGGKGGNFAQLSPEARTHLHEAGEIAHRYGYENIPSVEGASHGMWQKSEGDNRHILRAYTEHDWPGEVAGKHFWFNQGPEGGNTGMNLGREGLEEHLRELHGKKPAQDEEWTAAQEQLHKRDKGGKFTKGGGGGGAKTPFDPGDIPAPPEIPEATKIHQPKGAYKQKHLDALYQHAKNGEWDKIADYPTSGTNVYAKAVEKYKAQLIALRPKEGEGEAETKPETKPETEGEEAKKAKQAWEAKQDEAKKAKEAWEAKEQEAKKAEEDYNKVKQEEEAKAKAAKEAEAKQAEGGKGEEGGFQPGAWGSYVRAQLDGQGFKFSYKDGGLEHYGHEDGTRVVLGGEGQWKVDNTQTGQSLNSKSEGTGANSMLAALYEVRLNAKKAAEGKEGGKPLAPGGWPEAHAKGQTYQEWQKAREAAKQANKGTGEPTFSSDVSSTFVDSIKAAHEKLPSRIKDALKQHGTHIKIAKLLIDANPELKGQKPAGWSSGSTWDHVGGVYSWGPRRVTCGEFTRKKGELTATQKGPHTYRHEVGHAFDHAMGEITKAPGSAISRSEEFIKAYKSDRRKIPKDARWSLKYFLQKGWRGQAETFAEAIAQILSDGGGYSDVRKHFPKCTEIVKGLIA